MIIPKQCIRICRHVPKSTYHPRHLRPHRNFRSSAPLAVIKPFLLPDIGEGIKEVQIIQWFVEPEARVEQFDKICEVQSDKAAAEITSRYDGVIRKLHYGPEDMAQVGKPLCDIDVQGDAGLEAEAVIALPPQQTGPPSSLQQPQEAAELVRDQPGNTPISGDAKPAASTERHATLATPAVRGLLKGLDINIADLTGTGSDGRVLKDDVLKYAANRNQSPYPKPKQRSSQPSGSVTGSQIESPTALTPVQSHMFRTMTRSLSIPHFLYTDEIDLTSLSALRRCLNVHSAISQKLSYLPFIIKAVSLALKDFPLINARVEAGNDQEVPQLIMRERHNIGVAVDTPQGLLVPNIKNVSSLSILDIASELARLQSLARDGKLSVSDLTGGTITVSNIGSIGGTYVAPILVQSEVAILGIGKARTIPAFDHQNQVVKKEVINFSWSADHRVVDGATMARMAERVRDSVEEPGMMVAELR